MSADRKSGYFGEGNKDDLHRVDQMAMWLNPYSLEFHKRLQFPQPNALNVLDVGSGTGGEAEILKELYGGQITLVDKDPLKVKVIAETVERLGLKDRATVLTADALDLSQIRPESQDVVTMRFVLINNPAQLAGKILAEAKRVLRPDGIIVLEEPAVRDPITKNGQWHIRPPHSSFNILYQAFGDFLENRVKSDTEIGYNLPTILNENGFTVLLAHGFFEISSGPDPFKRQHLGVLNTASKAVIGAGFISQEEFDEQIKQLEQYIMQPTTIAFSLPVNQYAARKI